MSDKALAALKIIVVDSLLRSNPREARLLSARTLDEYRQIQAEFINKDLDKFFEKRLSQ